MKTMLGRGFAELAEDEGEKSVQTAQFKFNCSISQIRLAAGRLDVCLGPAGAAGGSALGTELSRLQALRAAALSWVSGSR